MNNVLWNSRMWNSLIFLFLCLWYHIISLSRGGALLSSLRSTMIMNSPLARPRTLVLLSLCKQPRQRRTMTFRPCSGLPRCGRILKTWVSQNQKISSWTAFSSWCGRNTKEIGKERRGNTLFWFGSEWLRIWIASGFEAAPWSRRPWINLFAYRSCLCSTKGWTKPIFLLSFLGLGSLWKGRLSRLNDRVEWVAYLVYPQRAVANLSFWASTEIVIRSPKYGNRTPSPSKSIPTFRPVANLSFWVHEKKSRSFSPISVTSNIDGCELLHIVPNRACWDTLYSDGQGTLRSREGTEAFTLPSLVLIVQRPASMSLSSHSIASSVRYMTPVLNFYSLTRFLVHFFFICLLLARTANCFIVRTSLSDDSFGKRGHVLWDS